MPITVVPGHQLLWIWEVPTLQPQELAGTSAMGSWGEKRDFWDNKPGQMMSCEHALGTAAR